MKADPTRFIPGPSDPSQSSDPSEPSASTPPGSPPFPQDRRVAETMLPEEALGSLATLVSWEESGGWEPPPDFVQTLLPDRTPERTMVSMPEGTSSWTPEATATQRLAGRYELLGLIGNGSMGAVYRARDLELDELVALKMLRRELIDAPGALQRFRQEVKLARRVTHRHVARVFDIGEHAGEKFLTMELIDGETLGALIEREGILPVSRVVEIGRALCAGLAAAHAAGVIHRDLKPDNVLIARDGRVVITDFGIARAALEGETHTRGEALAGTPAYMAPEQVEGDRPIDARVDLYALGAMLFEMLTGKSAWSGRGAIRVAVARLMAPPPDPRSHRPELSEVIARDVVRCMARAPEDRFPDATALAVALGRWTGQELVRPAPSSPAFSSRLAQLEPPRHADKSIAVLPLRNLGAAEDDYLAEGLTEDLIDGLAMTRALEVRPRSAVMAFRGSTEEPRTIGKRLEVAAVIDGSVRRVADQVRISLRLVCVAQGFQLWARRFDRPMADLLVVGDEAVADLAAALTVERPGQTRQLPTDPVVIELYLKGRQEHHRFSGAATARAVEMLGEAHRRAPGDPLIMAGYAMALARQFAFLDSWDRSGLTHDQLENAVRSLAGQALALSPYLAEARLALANVALSLGDGPAAARELREALIHAPGLADAHDLCGRLLVEIGRPEEGIARLRTALALEPGMIAARANIARALGLQGDWQQCDEVLDGPIPDLEAGNTLWMMRARMALWRRDRPRAERYLEALRDTEFTFRRGAIEILELTRTGILTDRFSTALEELAISEKASRRLRHFFWQLSTEALAFTGDVAAAMQALAASDAHQLLDLLWLDRCPLLENLRHHHAFATIRARVAGRAAATLEALSGGEG